MTSVSIVIPCFQAQETIERCVGSLFSAGSTVELEIILESDDGTDYDWVAQRFFNVRSYASGLIASGPGPSRNRGLGRAKGDWVCFIDSDDYVAPQFVDKMLATCLSHGAAVCRTHVVENGDRIGSFGQGLDALDLVDWAKSGISMRGMFARGRCPEFMNIPSQDIFHLVETILQSDGGKIQMSDAEYTMVTRANSVTTDNSFSDRVGMAYDDYIKIINTRYGSNAHAADAVDFFRAKKEINTAYEDRGASSSFYRFLFESVLSATL